MNDQQSDPTPAHASAIEKMKQEAGVWNCRWDFLDAQGDITNTANGTQTFVFAVDESLMTITTDAAAIGAKSIALRYFDPVRQKLVWQSVDNKGDHWTFIEKFDGEYSQSLPHKNPDQSTTHLRFRSLRETENEVDVLMELSNDGENWTEIFKMYRTRAN